MFRCFVIFFFFFFFFFFFNPVILTNSSRMSSFSSSSHDFFIIVLFFSIHRQVSISVVCRSHWHTSIVSHICSTAATAAARRSIRVLLPPACHCYRAPLHTPWRWAVRLLAPSVSLHSRPRRRPAPSCSCSSGRLARCRRAASPTANYRNRRPCSALRRASAGRTPSWRR
jgi:hypothetical protein